MIKKFWLLGVLLFLIFLDAPTADGVVMGASIPNVCVIAILKGDGYFKGNIKPAVWRFQKKNKIKPTGTINQKTEKVLIKRVKKYPKACAGKQDKKAKKAAQNPETGLPDLIITNFSLNPRFPVAGEEVKLEVEIRNIGSSTAKNIEYGYSIMQGVSIDYQVEQGCGGAENLKPQESCIAVATMKFRQSGFNLVILKADSETKIEESNEDNNNFGMLGVQVYESSEPSDRVKVFPVQNAIAARNASQGQKNVEFLRFKIADELDKDIKVLSFSLVLLGSAKSQDIDAIHWYDGERKLGTARFSEFGTGQNFASVNSDDPPGCSVPKECKEMFVVDANKDKVITITADISENIRQDAWAVFAMMESFYIVLGDKLTVAATYPITGNTVLIDR